MASKRIKGIVSACLVTALLCVAAFGSYMQNERKNIIEMENVGLSNILFGYVDAMDVYGSNLQILAFEKDNPVYIYKLHESLGLMKAGSDALSRETYGETFPEGLGQSMRDLTRQLSNFTYRFAGIYPKQSPEMDDSVSEMAKQIHQASRILDNALKAASGEPWIRNPANRDEWMLDRGYRLNDSSSDIAELEINRLIEENERIMKELKWR